MKTEYVLWEILRDLYTLPLNAKFISTFKGWEGHAIKIAQTGDNSRVVRWIHSPYGARESRSDPLTMYTAATDYPWRLVRSGATAHLFEEDTSIMNTEKNAAEVKSELLTTLQMMSKIQQGEIYVSAFGRYAITLSSEGDLVHSGDQHKGYPFRTTKDFMNIMWRKEEKQVDFWEAFCAYRGYNGKTPKRIKSVRNDVTWTPPCQRTDVMLKSVFHEDDIAGQWVILDD